MMKNKNILLEEIAIAFSKTCLSDLHCIPLLDIVKVIEKMNIYIYTVEQWSYGLSYILHTKINITNHDDIIRTLVCYKK